MKSISLIVFSVVVFFTPVVASAVYYEPTGMGYSFGYSSIPSGYMPGACITGGISCVASKIINIINYIFVPVLFAVAFIVFLYGVAKKYIFSHGESEAINDGHKLILWGLVGFVVMLSLWGLVNIVSNTFGLQGIGAPPTPKSY